MVGRLAEPLPSSLAALTANPSDADALGMLRRTMRQADLYTRRTLSHCPVPSEPYLPSRDL